MAAVTGGFFAAAEVSLILAFLNVIDNPDQDIPLLSVLMSPIYGFTAEDMAQLRRECGGETLYVSLLRAENERCVRVRDELTRFRALASTMPADSFINMLCTETGYENIVRAMPGGESALQTFACWKNTRQNTKPTGTAAFPASCALRSA